MLDQYTFLHNQPDFTPARIGRYHSLLVDAFGIDEVPGPDEINREMTNNGGILVLNPDWALIGGTTITEVRELSHLWIKEVGNKVIHIDERRKWVSTRITQILLEKFPDTALYSVVSARTSEKHTNLWTAVLEPSQLWTFFRVALGIYWSLDGQVILANQHAHILLTAHYS